MAPTYVVGSRDRYPTAAAAPHSADPPAGKRALRAACLARRAAVDAALREAQADRIAEEGLRLALAAASPGDAVAVFHPVRGEPDTLPLIAALDAAGFRTALPVAGARATPLAFRAWRPGESLARARLGLSEPPEGAAVLAPAVLFVPLAGFDRRGHRLGYGGGYYDATLDALARGGAKPHAIGVAFACQEVEAVPSEDHDAPLDALVTERETILFRA